MGPFVLRILESWAEWLFVHLAFRPADGLCGAIEPLSREADQKLLRDRKLSVRFRLLELLEKLNPWNLNNMAA